ncbi:MAG: hypothetical protein V7676_14305 [Parasphingorhabdus sp.]|uniref:hypothetical protein n=1 Tax=Parasphingorhabdus sp. TaxID=2709688 RepID=UPI00300314E2
MSHALIIEQNTVVGSALSRRLSDMGFDSSDHVWTEEDTVAIAEMQLAEGPALDGPFAFSKLSEVVETAQGQPHQFATAW